MALGLLGHLTHKGNLKETRYGWLRLTPAYSVHLVSELLDGISEPDTVVLDPFCGTGTTALVCAERGLRSITTDINPFLIWFARAKTRSYTSEEITTFRSAAENVLAAIRLEEDTAAWVPPLFQIEKWWDEPTLKALSRAIGVINTAEKTLPLSVSDLLKVVFCRVMIDTSNASFGHQSMSFKRGAQGGLPLFDAISEVTKRWESGAATVAKSAESAIRCQAKVLLCDARNLTTQIGEGEVSCVITSPPYPNRMSYIRELRPYMYWLGFLQDARAAGDLDWEAIGGTWGSATSKVGKWQPEDSGEIPHKGFVEILHRISDTSPLLSRYVHKYFYDMARHISGMYRVVRSGGNMHYIVGNSKFYDVMLPVEEIFASLFCAAGFVQSEIKTIRKRTSKKELYEFVVSAKKP